jgi:hypothetical protein
LIAARPAKKDLQILNLATAVATKELRIPKKTLPGNGHTAFPPFPDWVWSVRWQTDHSPHEIVKGTTNWSPMFACCVPNQSHDFALGIMTQHVPVIHC